MRYKSGGCATGQISWYHIDVRKHKSVHQLEYYKETWCWTLESRMGKQLRLKRTTKTSSVYPTSRPTSTAVFWAPTMKINSVTPTFEDEPRQRSRRFGSRASDPQHPWPRRTSSVPKYAPTSMPFVCLVEIRICNGDFWAYSLTLPGCHLAARGSVL